MLVLGMGVPAVPGWEPDPAVTSWVRVAPPGTAAVDGSEGIAVSHPPPTHGCSSYLGRVSQPAVPATGALGTLFLC